MLIAAALTQTTLIRVCDHLLVAYNYDTTRYVALQFTDRLDFTTREMRHAAMRLLGLSVWSLHAPFVTLGFATVDEETY